MDFYFFFLLFLINLFLLLNFVLNFMFKIVYFMFIFLSIYYTTLSYIGILLRNLVKLLTFMEYHLHLKYYL